ncbi:MAG: hypothetical protein ACQESC_01000 [Nanobdellota archaeon]
MEEKSPVFIKIEEYRKVLELVDKLKKKTTDVKKTVTQIKDLREKENDTIKYWEQKIDDIDKKIVYIDQTLFEPKS